MLRRLAIGFYSSIFAVLVAPLGITFGGPPPTGRVESCYFSTKSLPPTFHVPKQFAEGYKLFQAVGGLAPEQVTMKGVVKLSGPQLGLTAKESKELCLNLDRVYASISADALFSTIPSALPYCLSDNRPTQGHYFVYYPRRVTDQTPAIIFLHGFGGNFQFYIYLLKEEFPASIILAPSWGASWEDGTMRYLDDMLADVKRKKSLSVHKPALLAISAGGPAGFRLYNDHPDRFSCYVSLASAPPQAIVPLLKDDLRVLMINGEKDTRFRITHVKSLAAKIAARLPGFEFHIIDADHFFLLSKRDETFRVIKAFLGK